MRSPDDLRPHQRVMLDFLFKHTRCLLFAAPGAGKTAVALTYANALLAAGEVKRALVVAPLRVAQDVWTDEAARWSHLAGLRVVGATGSTAERRVALARRAHITAINYENLPWLVETLGDDWPFDMVIADECTKLKGFRLRQGGSRARALAKHMHKSVTHFVGLTGTPSPNGLIDLWGQVWFVDAGQRLGRSFSAFEDRYFRRAHRNGNFPGPLEPLPYAEEHIHAALRDICLTLDPKDYFDLKEPIVTDIRVKLPAKARQQYRDFERELFLELQGGDIEAVSAAAKTMKCLQLANGAVYLDPDGKTWETVHDTKLDALADLSEELGEPLLVAYHFRSDRERLLARFPDALDLSKPDDMRRAKDGHGRLWLGHPASMGHGVDGLQKHCRAIAFFAHDWNLENYLQIIERIGPMRQLQAGHNRNVFIYNLIAAESTMDEVVTARRTSKRTVQEALLAYMKGNQ
jgi:SNF2 family DNA or RNA helicase